MVVEKGRYVGIDLGKRTWEMAVITRSGKFKVNEQGDAEPEEKTARYHGTTTAEGRVKLYGKLEAGDKVVLEAGNLAFILAKELEKAVGCQIRVLNPSRLAIIYATDKKTDKEDAMKLAQLAADRPDSRLPIVAVPNDGEMEKRKLVSSYRWEQQARTRGINRLHAVFVHAGITTVVKKDLGTDQGRRETAAQLGGLEREEADHVIGCLKLHEERIRALGEKMAERAHGDERVERLQTVPGVGPKIAFVFSAYVNEGRFENGAQVSNYLGLVPRVYLSGSLIRYGGITKRGNGYLRALLVQGAWALTRSRAGGALKERYEYMTKVKGLGKKKAVVAVARRLGVLLYTLLKNGTGYEVKHFRQPGPDMEALALEALGA
ncbi:MAG: IS110 family transposase [Treponema sp.]|jgi:transposase|nr:IS110 family transposase [Treponema sp.]